MGMSPTVELIESGDGSIGDVDDDVYGGVCLDASRINVASRRGVSLSAKSGDEDIARWYSHASSLATKFVRSKVMGDAGESWIGFAAERVE